MRPFIRAFQERRYIEAAEGFERLAEKNPQSATLRVWLADARLFDRGKDKVQAAHDALVQYKEAERLEEEGCQLPRRPRYYRLMGSSYAHLRIMKAALSAPVA